MFGVIDIGSNSVRLVVFETANRNPITLFNEKAICAIGRNMVTTGRLDAEGMKLALAALKRFRLVATSMGVRRVHAVATAAARDAANGPDFVRRAEEACGCPIKVLTGEQEAQVIALRSGSPPKGFAHWSLRLLAETVVELAIAPAVSHETVRRTLKKTR